MKQLTILKIKLHVFLHYLPQLFKGLSLNDFLTLLKRLNLLISKLNHNKLVKVGSKLRLDLYVPFYPSRAFFVACDKFKVMDVRAPSTGALISVTNACPFACKHCYQGLDTGADADINLLVDATRSLLEHGTCFFNIEGGEPFLKYERLKAVCDAIDDRGEIWINSTGWGMTTENLGQLNPTAVMFSLHAVDADGLNQFMGRDNAWEALQNGINVCKKCAIPFALNACLPEKAFYNGDFEKIMNTAKKWGACLVQLIKPKPAGSWLEKEKPLFSPEGLARAIDIVNQYNLDKAYKDYPSVSAQIIEELPEVFGCTAGGTDRFYINAKGDVQPCEFLNISFGNIAEEPFEIIFARMRECFYPPGVCMLCETQAAKIHAIYKNSNLTSLPLPPEYAKQIYDSWDRGSKTDLYERAKN